MLNHKIVLQNLTAQVDLLVVKVMLRHVNDKALSQPRSCVYIWPCCLCSVASFPPCCTWAAGNSSARADLPLVNVNKKSLAGLFERKSRVYFKTCICLHDGTASKVWELKVSWGTDRARAAYLSPSSSTGRLAWECRPPECSTSLSTGPQIRTHEKSFY